MSESGGLKIISKGEVEKSAAEKITDTQDFNVEATGTWAGWIKLGGRLSGNWRKNATE